MAFEETLRDVAFAIVRLAGFGAGGFLLGLPVILLVVLRPSRAARPAAAWDRVAARLEGLVRAAICAGALGAAIALLLQALVVADLRGGEVSQSAFSSVLASAFGRWYGLRLPLVGALAVLLVGRMRSTLSEPGTGGDHGKLWWTVWLVLAGCLVATGSLSGHAAASEPVVAAVLNDVVHLAAGSVWFAGIVVLGAVLPRAARRLEPPERLAFLVSPVVRFSRVALIAIGVVAATGTINSFFNVETFGDLGSSGYGRVLSAKITAFLLILVFGGINHLYVRRRFERIYDHDSAVGAQRIFRRTIAAELALAVAVIVMTSALVGLARTRTYSGGLSGSGAAGDASGSVASRSPPQDGAPGEADQRRK